MPDKASVEYDIQCPYCGSLAVIPEYLVCGGTEGELYQRKCEACNMMFVFRIELRYAMIPQKANCLNGMEHRYEETFARPRRFAKLRCRDCKDEQPLPADWYTDLNEEN
jgi:ribosomal protein S27E